MRDPKRRDDPTDLPIVPGVGGGQPITPSDNSFFGQEPEPAPDLRGVNEEDVTMDDAELEDAGESPEFDHSLRKRPSSGS